MQGKYLAVICIAGTITIVSCSKKHVPENTATTTAASTSNSTKAEVKKPVVKKTVPSAVPNIIVVNDKAAKKSFDGRLYYDIDGRRYWRNYNDGKYYLFNKSMYSDSAFIPH